MEMVQVQMEVLVVRLVSIAIQREVELLIKVLMVEMAQILLVSLLVEVEVLVKLEQVHFLMEVEMVYLLQ